MHHMTRTRLPALVALVTLLATPVASAETLAICHEGGPGTTRQAAKAVTTFLRHMEGSAGLTPDSLQGEYHTKRAGCDGYIAANSPLLVVLDLATHLRLTAKDTAKRPSLTPLGHLGKPDATTWHVIVRKGTYADLAALDGKTLLVTGSTDTTFVRNIALAGQGGGLTLEPIKRPLKAVRKVGRGQAEAALVDQDTLAHLGDLELPHELVSIHDSAGLPGLILSATGSGETVTKVKAALPTLCEGEGRKLCKTFGVKRFRAADQGLLKRLSTRYTQGK